MASLAAIQDAVADAIKSAVAGEFGPSKRARQAEAPGEAPGGSGGSGGSRALAKNQRHVKYIANLRADAQAAREARAQVAVLTRERNEARALVAQLTRERDVALARIKALDEIVAFTDPAAAPADPVARVTAALGQARV